MAGFNYTRILSTANRLITRYGASMTMEVVTTSVFDRETGEAPQTDSDVTVTAVLLDAKEKFLDGVLVKTGDRRALVKAGGLSNTPQQGYYIVTPDLGRFYIDESKPLAPNGSTTLLYGLTLKKGGNQASENFGAFLNGYKYK